MCSIFILDFFLLQIAENTKLINKAIVQTVTVHTSKAW